MRNRTDSPGQAGAGESANDRFKRSFSDTLWRSLIAATVLHFGVFALGPELVADDISIDTSDLERVELPELDLPEPPEKIPQPAEPIVSTTDVVEDVTIPLTTFDANPVDDLPPPPERREGDSSAAPGFTPHTVSPEIKNVPEVLRALEREYPSVLRDAGIGGQVVVWFHIDENGRVQDKRIARPSGHAVLDEAAMKVAEVYEFSPALNLDRRVSVWVQFAITFEVR